MKPHPILIAATFLLFAACDDDITLTRSDWRCSNVKTLQTEVCTQTALDFKFRRQGTCRLTPVQECLQWTKAK